MRYLGEALAQHAFLLHYQPIVDLSSAETIGFEALIRWHHPTRGVIGPPEFIGAAEESGLIVDIGDWVLERAIGTATTWQPLGRRRGVSVNVNVSARQLARPGFARQVRRQLDAFGLPPERLTLEITESMPILDAERVWDDLRPLGDAGVRIALDDFGTRQSPLSHLRRRPIDQIKLDQSFVRELSVSADTRSLVRAIIQFGQSLGLQVIAEGIESRADCRMLRDMGCTTGQGYLFGRPLSSQAATDHLVDAIIGVR